MIGSVVLNRNRDVQLSEPTRGRSATRGLLNNFHDSHSPDESPEWDPTKVYDEHPGPAHPQKQRNCCGMNMLTPNSSRFAGHWHSRVLQKFPFLVEMFYWALNFVFYVVTKAIAARWFAGDDGLWDKAQSHGVAILELEHSSWLSFLFPIHEADFQRFFLGHRCILTFLNRIYSLVHIPGTVTYVWSSPSPISPPH